MAMPEDFVMVRHGQSEPNVVQAMFKADEDAQAPEGFYDRHDSHMRLSSKGREQAAAAGEWLMSQFGGGFDAYYTSSLVRTCETAGRLALGGDWIIDDRWRERDWGEYGILNQAEQASRYDLSHRLRAQHRWYWCPPGGESLATGVRLRFEDILDTAHRELDGKKLIAVTHGEMIDVARFVLERMTPDEWTKDNKDPSRKVQNCQTLHYTRRNPETREMSPQLRWFRSICPWDQSKSWNNGEWIAIPPRRRYSDQELLDDVDHYPRLLEE